MDILSEAFQTIRDHTLAGKLPMVFFDTFDAAFGMKLDWPRYFLNPMQRGKFLDHGKEHPLGRAVFFFITSSYSTPPSLPSPLTPQLTTLSESRFTLRKVRISSAVCEVILIFWAQIAMIRKTIPCIPSAGPLSESYLGETRTSTQSRRAYHHRRCGTKGSP
jgi:hypothetical protein